MNLFNLKSPVVELSLGDNGMSVYKSPVFHEVSVLGEDTEGENLPGRIAYCLERLDERHYHLKNVNADIQLDKVVIPLNKLRGLINEESIPLTFHYIHWQANQTHFVAYVPVLNINVIAGAESKLAAAVINQIVRALQREGAISEIGKLLLFDRVEDISCARQPCEFKKRTKQEEARIQRERQERLNSVLNEFVDEFKTSHHFLCFDQDDKLELIRGNFNAKRPPSILIVGPSGCGKTALIHELCRTKEQNAQLKYMMFWETTGSRIVAGMCGFGEWQERCLRLCREAKKKNALLYLGNLFELMEEGKSESQSQNIADFLVDSMRKGELVTIMECTEEQLALVEKDSPKVANAFEIVRLDHPSREETFSIVRQWLNYWSFVKWGDEALESVISLHQRFSGYSASPGREVRFLSAVVHQHDDRYKKGGIQLEASEVYRHFKERSGLPDFLLGSRSHFDWTSAKTWFEGRVAGQDTAVQAVVDTITTIKAGMQRSGKPIANLLFTGPTGVGKTQLSRSLAEYLFGDESRLIRFDMSEYQTASAVRRLVGSPVRKSGVLTGKIREQPFSVVLFDEFEKAHPDFFDLLLQICGEGRLSDALGRVASFSSSVVIMTSNLGAERAARGHVGFGSSSSGSSDHSTFIDAIQEHLRPEIFNRIDRIVPFGSLSEEVIRLIASWEIKAIAKRHGIMSRRIRFEHSQELEAHLAREGFDIRYGARPLKRFIGTSLLVPLSSQLSELNEEGQYHIVADLDAEGSVRITCNEVKEDRTKQSDIQKVERLLTLRRNFQTFRQNSFYQELRNRCYRKSLSKKNPGFTADPHLNEMLYEIDELWRKVEDLEDETLFHYYRESKVDDSQSNEYLKLESEWWQVLKKTDAFELSDPDQAVFTIYGKSHAQICELVEYYHNAFSHLDKDAFACTGIKALLLDPEKKQDEKETPDLDDIDLTKSGTSKKQLNRHELRAKKKLLSVDFKSVEDFLVNDDLEREPCFIGVAIGVNFPFAYSKLKLLNGFVEVRKGKKPYVMKLETVMKNLSRFQPEEKGRFSPSYYRVKDDPGVPFLYLMEDGKIEIRDAQLLKSLVKKTHRFTKTNLPAKLSELIETAYMERIKTIFQ